MLYSEEQKKSLKQLESDKYFKCFIREVNKRKIKDKSHELKKYKNNIKPIFQVDFFTLELKQIAHNLTNTSEIRPKRKTFRSLGYFIKGCILDPIS